MKAVILICLLSACATVNPYAYEESERCPEVMSDSQIKSGEVRCRAMCASYARDYVQFAEDCKCFCAPPGGQHTAQQM